MSKPDNLTDYARAGYDGAENPHLWSSACWYAHSFGRYMHDTGRPIPTDVRMSRGQSIRCRDMRFSFKHNGTALAFTREY
jgi:hypothetical protein